MESKFLVIIGKKMHYKIFREQGSEKPFCIFIHGANPESQHTEFWTPLLSIITQNCQPIFLDGYGHGLSAKPEANETVDFNLHLKTYREFIKGILSEEKISSCILIGRSLGGAITHSLAKEFDAKLIGIGLIAPAGAGRITQTLQGFSKKVSVLWDSQDPMVGFEGYGTIQSTVKQVKLFVIGADTSVTSAKNQERKPNTKPSHVPELQYPELFSEFLKSLTN